MYFQSLETKMNTSGRLSLNGRNEHAQIISPVYCSGASVLSVRSQQWIRNTRQRGHSQVQYTEFRRGVRSSRWLAGRPGKLFRSGSGQRYNPRFLGYLGKSEHAWAANDKLVNVVDTVFYVTDFSLSQHSSRILRIFRLNWPKVHIQEQPETY